MERALESLAGVTGDEGALYSWCVDEVSRWLYRSAKRTKNTWGQYCHDHTCIVPHTVLTSRSYTQSVSGSVLVRMGVSSLRPSNKPNSQFNTESIHTVYSTLGFDQHTTSVI